MAYLSAIASVVQVILYPFALVLGWVLVALSPVWHLLRVVLYALRLPLRIIASLEPLYVYLGTAVVVGIVMGSIMHLSSTALISALHLRPSLDDEPPVRRSAARPRERRGGRTYRAPISANGRPRTDDSRLTYADRHDQSRAQQKGGLLSQIILEEDDSDGMS